MADNTRLNVGTGGDLIKTEDIAGQYKIGVSKIYLGSHGVDGGPVSPSNAFPVDVQNAVSLAGPVDVNVQNPVSLAGPVEVTVQNPVDLSGPIDVRVQNSVALSGPVSLDGPVAVAGPITTIPATGQLVSGSSAIVPKFARVEATGQGTTTIVPAVAGKSIRVLQYLVVADGDVSVDFRSGPTTGLTGTMALPSRGGVGASSSPLGQFETLAGEPLVINLSNATVVGGHLVYIEV